MSTQNIENQIEKFLLSIKPEIIGINGEWGTGKTHFWKETVLESSEKKSIGMSSYSYVSLFGIDSLDDLKIKTYVNSVDSEKIDSNGDKFKFQNLLNNKDNIFKKIISGTIKTIDIPNLKSLSPLVDNLLKDTLICFDDLERAGKSLSINEILGFASILREERNCKVVFIHHIDKDIDKRKGEFKQYSEKVFDYQLTFQPNSEECCKIIFNDNDKYDRIIENVLKLNITNIRILSILKNFYNEVLPYVKDKPKELLDDYELSLPLIVLSKFAGDNQAIPNIELLKKKENGFLRYVRDEKKERNDVEENERKMFYFLENYGFYGSSSFVLELIDIVERGYVIPEKIVTSMNSIEAQSKEKELKQKYSESWKTFYGPFDINVDEVKESITTAFKECISILNLVELNSLVLLLRDLEDEDHSSEMIDFFFSQKHTNESYYDNFWMGFSDDEWDSEVKTKAEQTRLEMLSSITLDKAMEYCFEHGTANPRDKQAFKNASAEDIDNYIKKIPAKNFVKTVRMLQKAYRSLHISDSRLTSVLTNFGNENKLNKVRLKRIYGIPSESE